MFQRKFANAYPPTLDVLVEQKFLRKKYKDPITNEDFVPLTQAQGQAAATPGGQAARGRGQQQTPPAQGGRGTNPFAGAATPGAAVGGIIGVTSKSTDTSIRLYKGRSHYNKWAFVYTAPAGAGGAGGAGAPGGAGGRGQRGQGQNPQPNTSPFPGPGGPPGRGDGRGPFGPGGPGGRGRRWRRAIPLPNWSRPRTITSRRVKTTGAAVWLALDGIVKRAADVRI